MVVNIEKILRAKENQSCSYELKCIQNLNIK